MTSWKVSPLDQALITDIVDRAAAMASQHPASASMPFDTMQATMDLACCHTNGCRLDLARLLAASTFDFAHDLWGISEHLDRSTGKLGGCFVPRFAAREAVSA